MEMFFVLFFCQQEAFGDCLHFVLHTPNRQQRPGCHMDQLLRPNSRLVRTAPAPRQTPLHKSTNCCYEAAFCETALLSVDALTDKKLQIAKQKK